MQNHYYRTMCRWMLLSGALFAASCSTKENPAAKCSTGTCTDPAAPFCDVDGTVGGTPGMCLGVTCMPGEFKACRGDVALTCNSNGNNYDELLCQKGCTPEAQGCKLCEPGQTLCANGEVQTCDENGAVTASESCPLGCFEDQPRCRDIDASNGLSAYLDMVPSPPDLNLANAIFDTETGQVTDGQQTLDVPSFSVSAPAGGVAIRVFVANDVTIANATVTNTEIARNGVMGPAFALIAKGAIHVTGTIAVAGVAGSVVGGTCSGGKGHERDDGTRGYAAGGGGGAFATDGGKGGDVLPDAPAGAAGLLEGTDALVPLRGGCAGGGMLDYVDTGGVATSEIVGGLGGGAIQLVSGTRIQIDGVIDARGSTGGFSDFSSQSFEYAGDLGGGAGGGALLEAPAVSLGPLAKLLATGGDGAQACQTPDTFCKAGGKGATSGTPATAGVTSSIQNAGPGTNVTGGGGGGGLGRIRINTKDQTYTKANTTVEDGSLTVGTAATR